MRELFWDMETLPTNDPDVIKEIAEGVTPPKTMSKPETIAKWEAEEKPRLIEEAVSKTALDGTYGRVCCITFAFDDEKVQGIIDRDEKNVITLFFQILKDVVSVSKGQAHPLAIGHNITGFDLKFLWKRAIILGIQPSFILPWDSKPWGERVYDTMVMWDSDKDKRISLHNLCRVLGVESPKDKNGITGADVADLWMKRQYDKIKTYGMDDVEAVRQCYRKMTI